MGSKNCLSGPEDSKIDEYSLIQQSVLVAKVFEKLCSGLSVEKCVKRSAAPLRTRTTEPVGLRTSQTHAAANATKQKHTIDNMLNQKIPSLKRLFKTRFTSIKQNYLAEKNKKNTPHGILQYNNNCRPIIFISAKN